MREFCVCTRCAMPLIRSSEPGISITKSDEQCVGLPAIVEYDASAGYGLSPMDVQIR
jgi:hypothetical protein